jgi:hypothetical protein
MKFNCLHVAGVDGATQLVSNFHEEFKMLSASLASNQSAPEDIEMARMFRNELQMRIRRRNTLANVINLRWPRAKTQAAPVQDYRLLFEVPLFNQIAA